MEPIEDEFLPRLGVVYGTSELHSAHDYHSFTEMLDKVVRENNFSLPFTQISRYKLYIEYYYIVKIEYYYNPIAWSTKLGQKWRSSRNPRLTS